MRAICYVLFLLLISSTVLSGTVSNVSFKQTEYDEIVIYYDLAGESDESFEIKLFLSQDGWENFMFEPISVRGDVGPNISAGQNKQIVWEVLRDMGKLVGDSIKFKITSSTNDSTSTIYTHTPPGSIEVLPIRHARALPAGAIITIDGDTIEGTKTDVKPGPYTVIVTAPGRKNFIKQIKVKSGKTVEVRYKDVNGEKSKRLHLYIGRVSSSLGGQLEDQWQITETEYQTLSLDNSSSIVYGIVLRPKNYLEYILSYNKTNYSLNFNENTTPGSNNEDSIIDSKGIVSKEWGLGVNILANPEGSISPYLSLHLASLRLKAIGIPDNITAIDMNSMVIRVGIGLDITLFNSTRFFIEGSMGSLLSAKFVKKNSSGSLDNTQLRIGIKI